MQQRLTPFDRLPVSSRFRLFPILVLGMACFAGGRGSSAAGPELSNVTIGIRGQFQVGRWTSFEADVVSETWPVQLSILVPDPDGNLTHQPSLEIARPDQPPAHVRTLFKTGRLGETIRVELQSPDAEAAYVLHADTSGDDVIVLQFDVPWTPATQLWAILGEAEPFRLAADRIIGHEGGNGRRQPVQLIELSDADELPTQPDGLESLRVLAVVGPHDVSAGANEAIRQWVAGGGHLILSLGQPDEYETVAFSDWIPLRVTGQSRLRDLSALTVQVPGGVPIRVNTVDALQFEFDDGDTIASTLDGPLWAQLPYGFGRVSVLGADMSRRPLVDWPSLPLLCERLADYERVSDQSQQRTGTQLSQTGVSELQTQLVNGLDQYSQIDKPSSWLAMGMILAYMLAIGPLDYLIVHKLLRRPHWTWVTFPIMVLLGIGLATMTATGRNSEKTLANQVDLVDVDLASQKTRIQSWMSFTSPDSQRYTIAARPAGEMLAFDPTQDPSIRLSWTGIPETGFRGMYRTGGLDLAKAAYELPALKDEILGLPVAVWSSANATATIGGFIDGPDRIVTANLETEASQLSGTITNRLQVPLENWFVAHEGRVFLPLTRRAGASALKIAPGETVDFADGTRVWPRVLHTYLTDVRRVKVRGKGKVGDDVVATRDAYNPLARDPYGTLRMVSFFQAGNGDDFTALTNHAMDRLDLSPLLPLGRAVLYCRVRLSATTFTLNDKPLEPIEHDTILRIVLPVKKR